jgi:thioredoxin reductase (NADPH)
MEPSRSDPRETFDVLVVGAGPTGLACAIEAQRAGLRTVVVDKGCLCNSLFHYPSGMTFFTTPELLEIGDMPFSSPNQKPSRNEALEYYRKVVLATGYYDLPNYLEVPGEDLPKVLHYYHDPHPYYDQKVLVIGGKNSAAIAALDLWRHGAQVTLVHRGEVMHHHVKYWILPDINNRIKNGEVAAYFSSSVTSISEDSVELLTPKGTVTLENDYVFALTGYHPDFAFLAAAGVRMEGLDRCPACDPQSLESNVPGLYLAGVIVAGARTNEIFIENGRFHGRQIAQDMEAKLAGRTSVKVG